MSVTVVGQDLGSSGGNYFVVPPTPPTPPDCPCCRRPWPGHWQWVPDLAPAYPTYPGWPWTPGITWSGTTIGGTTSNAPPETSG